MILCKLGRCSIAAGPAGAALAFALLVSGCTGSAGTSTNTTAVGRQLLNKALKEQAQGQIEQASQDYEALVAQDPKSKLGHYNLGLIAQLAGDDTTATARYNTTLTIDPGYDPALYNLAIITDKRGDAKGATDLYRRAIAANPKGANAHFNLGLLLRRLGRSRDGVAELNTAIALNPSLQLAIAPSSPPAPVPKPVHS